MSKLHIPQGRGAAAGRPKARRLSRWLGRLCGILIGLVFLPILAVSFVFLISLERSIGLPSWAKARAEVVASQLLSGGEISFEDIRVVLGQDLHPKIDVHGITLLDAQNSRLLRVPRVEVQLSPRGLLFEQLPLVQHIRSEELQVFLQRDETGGIDVDFGQKAAFEQGFQSAGPALTPAQFLESFDSLFEQPLFAALEDVTLAGVELTFDDRLRGQRWHGQSGFLQLRVSKEETELLGSFDLQGRNRDPAHMSFSYLSPRESLAVEVGVLVAGVPAADLGRELDALGWLVPLDATLSGQLALKIDEFGQLGDTSARVELGEGFLAPSASVPAVQFEKLVAALDYDASAAKLNFQELSVVSDRVSFTAAGQALLAGFEAGMPRDFVSQLRIVDLALPPMDGLLSEAVTFPAASADLRLRLDPFTLDFVQITLSDDISDTLLASGQVRVAEDGWHAAFDAEIETLPTERLLELWPPSMQVATLSWLERNLSGGAAKDLNFALRVAPDQPVTWSLASGFEDLQIQVMRDFPKISSAKGILEIHDGRLSVGLHEGHAATPEGRQVDLTGTEFILPNMRLRPIGAEVGVTAKGALADVLWVVDQLSLRPISRSGLALDMGEGAASLQGNLTFPLTRQLTFDQIDMRFDGEVSGFKSTRLVPNFTLEADSVAVHLDRTRLEIGGAVAFGRGQGQAVRGEVLWALPFGQKPRLTGEVELTAEALSALGIALPARLSGRAKADLSLRFDSGAPQFVLTSDLRGLGIEIADLSDRKTASEAGRLEVEGRFGAPVSVSHLLLDWPGLLARGSIEMGATGFERAQFSRVRLGRWLDAPVTLVGRGGRPPAIEVSGGTLDITRAPFGSGGGSSGAAMGPMQLRFDEVKLWAGLRITDLRGQLSGASSLDGRFEGRLNGRAPVTGLLVSQNGSPAVRLTARNGGEVLAALGFFEGAQGGEVDLTLLPNGPGRYTGSLSARDLSLRNTGLVLHLLDAASGFGFIQQAIGQGVLFDQIEADFRLDPGQITLAHGFAAGAGLGISLDGAYSTATERLDFQGVLSPVYFLNSMGAPMTRAGEGVFGLTFTLGGTRQAISLRTNPLSLLAPGLLREMFRRPTPQVLQ